MVMEKILQQFDFLGKSISRVAAVSCWREPEIGAVREGRDSEVGGSDSRSSECICKEAKEPLRS